MSAKLVSYEEEYDYSDELDEEFQKLCLAQERIINVTQKAHLATSFNGVASFDEDEDEDRCTKNVNWETIGACYDYVGIESSSDLDKLLKSIPHHKNATGFGDNDTCSTSEGSINTSSTRGTVFVSSADALTNKKKAGSKSVKTKLRAIASIIDPKLSQKIKNRRGFWSGVHEENVDEGAVEVVCVP